MSTFQNRFTNNQSITPANQFTMQPMEPIKGLNNSLMAEWGKQPTASNFMSSNAANSGTVINTGSSMGSPNAALQFNQQGTPGAGISYGGARTPDSMPGVKGAWVDKANFGLGVAQVGLGVYNAMEQSKMNKFMRSYYGDQIAMMKTDFTNAAKDANSRLQWQQQERIASQGQDPNSDASKQATADYMAQWGAKETV